MKAEIIAVGSEMLTPNHVDTNSLFITGKLNEAGFEVHLKTIVGDRESDIESVLRAALERSTLIVFSGGLGPTEDDLTRNAVARVLGRELKTDPALVEALKQRFARRAIPMAAINERQAQVIEGAEILKNPLGTAPGMFLTEREKCIALLPGPPRELKPMLESQVLPRVKHLAAGRRLVRRSLRISGVPESEVDSIASPVYKAHPAIQTTVLAAPGYIGITLVQWLAPDESADEIDSAAAEIQSRLGDVVFSTGDESIEEVVGGLLRRSGLTLAVAESCTSGMLGMRITRVPGSSDYFLGGVLCYSNDVKEKLCGVPGELLTRCGAVSAETAEALARGIRAALGSSIGVATTGIAGPGGGTEEKPVGLVYFGLADGERVHHVRRLIPGDREAVREHATSFALSLLRRFVLPENPGKP